MAPSIMSAPIPIRKRKGRADSPSSSNDIASVPVAPVKAANGSNGTNGNGVSVVNEINLTKQMATVPPLEAKLDILVKTELGEIRQFNCAKHVRPAQFPDALEALPFPKDLSKLVAWTDAFVERLGWAALQADQKTAVKQNALDRSNQEIEKLNLRIRDLQTLLHNSVTDNHKLRGEISQSASRARSLEEQHKWDREQIEAFNKTISEKQTTIWRLTKENEKKQTSLDRLVARVKKISADEKEDHRMIRELEEWKKADKVHDDAVEKLVNELEKKVETQTAETKKAESKADTASKRVKVLEAENAGLATLEAQLTERIKHIAEQLKKLEGDFGVSEGQKATLEALLCELKKKEFNAKIEIESLHQRLHDAKDIVKDAKLEVKKAQLHAKNHWGTLENIRMDGGWLRTYESDECEEKTMVPICRLGPSEPLTRPAADIQASVN